MDDAPDATGRYGAALLFVRWAEGGDRPDGHLETEYLAHGLTPEEALAPLLAMTLHQIQQQLERRIAAQGRE
ncbi:MAG: hypothetical protein ACREMW_15310 [Gemmatimonadales bacterium]